MKRHACPTCHLKHTPPKASNVLLAFVRGIAFMAIEVLAALALDGWLSIAVWAIAAWNLLYLSVLVTGLAFVAQAVATDAPENVR